MRYKIGQAWSPNDPRLADVMSAPVRASGIHHRSGQTWDDQNTGSALNDAFDVGDRKQRKVADGLASARSEE